MSAAPIAGTVLALLAFAANSLLCRLALAGGTIDAGSFTAVRLASGALVLALLVRAASGSTAALRWRGAAGPVALLLYALPFSYAYLRIGAATGALVLFGSVQLTMLGTAIARGERPRPIAWLGFALAAGGLVWLVGPSAQRPDAFGVALMATAGIAWGVYTVIGRRAGEPIAANARAFLWSALFAVFALAVAPASVAITPRGASLAAISGGLTSGLGYAIWYRALPHLTVARAAFAQLAVPVLAALGAVVWLGEPLTLRFVGASVLVLGGMALALAARARR
jgi:drug/metabolite transporter (DMT)-like permease